MSYQYILPDSSLYAQSKLKLRSRATTVHKNSLLKFKDSFKNKNVAIVGGGPTLNLFKTIENTIYIGVNDTFLFKNINFDFFFINDYNIGIIHLLNKYSKNKCKKFYGINLQYPHCIIPDSERIASSSDKIYINNQDGYHNKNNLSEDIIICERSTIFTALEFALFGNPQNIYLIGCDCSFGGAITNKGRIRDNYHHLIIPWKRIKNYISKFYPHIKVTSINPRKLRGLFNDIYQNKPAVDTFDYIEKGMFKEAVLCAQKALKEDPKNLNIVSLLIESLLKNRNIKFAESICNKYLSKNTDWAEGYTHLSLISEAKAEELKAIEYAQKAIQIDPLNIHIRTYLTKLLINSGAISEAETIIREGGPDFSDYWASKFSGEVLDQEMRGVKLDNIIKSLQYASKISEENKMIKVHLSIHKRKNNEYKDAENIINKIIEKYPLWPEGYNQRSYNYEVCGKLIEAIKNISTAIKLAPYALVYWERLIDLVLKKGDYIIALDIIKNIYKDTPSWNKGLLLASKIYTSLGKLEEGIIAAQSALAIESSPLVNSPRPQLALLLCQKNNFSSAKRVIQQGLNLDSGWGDGWRQLSKLYEADVRTLSEDKANKNLNDLLYQFSWNILYKIYLLIKEKNLNEAEKLGLHLITTNADWSLAWLYFSYIYKEKKDKDRAIKMAYKAFELDPNNRIIYENLNKLLKNDIDTIDKLLKEKKFEEAYIKSLKLVDKANKLGTCHRLFAMSYEGLGCFDMAIEVEKNAIKNNLYSIQWNRVHLISLYLAQKRIEEAEKEAKELVSIHPDWGISWRQLSFVSQKKGDLVLALEAAQKAFEISPEGPNIKSNLKNLLKQ